MSKFLKILSKTTPVKLPNDFGSGKTEEAFVKLDEAIQAVVFNHVDGALCNQAVYTTMELDGSLAKKEADAKKAADVEKKRLARNEARREANARKKLENLEKEKIQNEKIQARSNPKQIEKEHEEALKMHETLKGKPNNVPVETYMDSLLKDDKSEK